MVTDGSQMGLVNTAVSKERTENINHFCSHSLSSVLKGNNGCCVNVATRAIKMTAHTVA